jgi:glycosyltransferase involved in cell wall biosynthesis
MIKRIYPLSQPHSSQSSIIRIPPEGYVFTKTWEELNPTQSIGLYRKIKNKLSYNPILKSLWEYMKRFKNPILDQYESMKGFDIDPKIKESDLIFTGQIIPTDKPYWIDVEHVRQLMGWDINLLNKNKEWISEQLARPECVLITSYTKAGIDTVIDYLPNSNLFKHKCGYYHNAIPSVDFIREVKDKKDIVFLFMSSYNLPYDFNFKGGNIVLETFSRLINKYPNIKLIIKSWVPKDLLKKYSHIKQIEFRGISPYSEMDKIFKESDIFLSPNHNTPAQAYLDCMNYSIPIITTDLWANSEIVKDNYNGLLIPPSNKVPCLIYNNIPNSRSPDFNKAIDIVDEDLVLNLYRRSEELINDWKLRKKLGLNGKKEIDTGEFSIEYRNKTLKALLDNINPKGLNSNQTNE